MKIRFLPGLGNPVFIFSPGKSGRLAHIAALEFIPADMVMNLSVVSTARYHVKEFFLLHL